MNKNRDLVGNDFLVRYLRHQFILDSAELVSDWPGASNLSTILKLGEHRRLIFSDRKSFVMVKEMPHYLSLENWIGPRVHSLAYRAGLSVSEPLISKDESSICSIELDGKMTGFAAQRLVSGSIWSGRKEQLLGLTSNIRQLSAFLGGLPAVTIGGTSESLFDRVKRLLYLAEHKRPTEINESEWSKTFEAIRHRIQIGSIPMPVVLAHGDVNPTNAVFGTNGESTLFDFDDARWCPEHTDLASLALFASTLTIDIATKRLVHWSSAPDLEILDAVMKEYWSVGNGAVNRVSAPIFYCVASYVYSVMVLKGYITKTLLPPIRTFFEGENADLLSRFVST